MKRTRYLLDVNVLIALIDPKHTQHDVAHEWFAAHGHHAWATCPITENGVARIVGHPRYPNSPGTPAEVAKLVVGLRALPGHVFWGDSISLFDGARIDTEYLLTSAQITDSYLLALASANGGQLATLDRRLISTAVRGGAQYLHIIG